MRNLIAVLTAIVLSISAHSTRATTIKEFDAKPDKEQSACVADFIDRMTSDIRTKNEPLAIEIRNWFAVKPEGKATSAGMERLYVELTALDLKAREGKADQSKIQLESVIVWIVKQKFPPPAQAAKQ
jgi:hypothetical protein